MRKQRIKTGTMLTPNIIQLCDDNIENAKCKSRNDFIEDAIMFYAGYFNKDDNIKYNSQTIESLIVGTVGLGNDTIAKLLFKFSVELNMMMNVISATHSIDESTLTKLRGKCVMDVKNSHGKISFEDTVAYQKRKQ